MTHDTLSRIQLQPGQAWRVAVDARTSVQVLRGRVVLREASASLADGLPGTGIPLAEGQVHRVVQAGWIDVLAQGDAEVLSYRQPAWLVRASHAGWMRVGALVGALRSARKGAAA